MDDLSRVRSLIASGKRREAWDLLNEILTNDPRNEDAWLLVYGLASNSQKGIVLEKARGYLPDHSILFPQSMLFGLETAEEVPTKSRLASRGALVLVSVLGVVTLFCAASFLIANSTAYAQFSSRLVSQPTVVPTRRATNTPLRPTATLRPQAIQDDPGDLYLGSINPLLSGYMDAWNRFLRLDESARVDETLKDYEPWRREMEATLSEMRVYSRQMAQVRPVPGEYPFPIFHKMIENIETSTEGLIYYYKESMGQNPGWRMSALVHARDIQSYINELRNIIDEQLRG